MYSFNQQGIVKVGAVNADEHKSLGSKFGVSGYPTIKIFKGRDHSQYQGQRTANAMVEAALQAAKEVALARLGKKSGSGDKVKLLNMLKTHQKGKISPYQQRIINKFLDYIVQYSDVSNIVKQNWVATFTKQYSYFMLFESFSMLPLITEQ